MNTINTQPKKGMAPISRQRSYAELIEFLDHKWSYSKGERPSSIKLLDQAFGSVSKKINALYVSGHNGKSLTIGFASQLFNDEGYKVGAFFSPHVLNYNERISIDGRPITNRSFADLANEVLNIADTENINVDTMDVLTMVSLLYFYRNNVDVVLYEIKKGDPLYVSDICQPKIAAITRVEPQDDPSSEENKESLQDLLHTVEKNTHVIAADQSKLNLQIMADIAKRKGGLWAMPIRKLAPLPYPFEQLHGRCAALAERVAEIFINNFVAKDRLKKESLLAKQKGQRGRPTLAAKRQAELNPKRTITHFWNETSNSLSCRFQLLDKEKPSVLLDNANNIDAFKNLFLGIRLLHYKKPLKGLSLIIGSDNGDLEADKILKLFRYFFKKTSGNIIVCPMISVPGDPHEKRFDAEKVANDIKSIKIKAHAVKKFSDAFHIAKNSVDERSGLIVIAGSASLIAEYWKYKGSKKL